MIENIISIVIMFVLTIWTITDIILNKNEKRALIICSILIIGVVLAEMCCTIFENTEPDNRIMSIIGNVVGFSLSPFIFTIESYVYDKKNTIKKFIPSIINVLLVIISIFTGWIFSVNGNNIYSRGPLYFIFIIIFIFSIALSLISKINAVRTLPGYFKMRIVVSCLMMFTGLTFQVAFPQYHSTWIIICVFFILDYAIICEISSMVDGLTGLLNKIVFNKQIQMIQNSENNNKYIIVLDVNDFKLVNDNYGHLYGDKCLCEIALVLKESFKKNANIFRFGGDEFCVLVNSQSDISFDEQIETLNNRFIKCKKKLEHFPDIAVGYARFDSTKTPLEVIDNADFLMYARKKEMKSKELI